MEILKTMTPLFLTIADNVKNFFFPQKKEESFFFPLGRFIITLTVLGIPLLYDTHVPEVAGDVRWNMMHASALLLLSLFMASLIRTGTKLSFKAPFSVWCVILLVFLSVVTMLWTETLPRSWWFLKNFLAYATLFSFIIYLKNDKWYRNLLWIIAITVLLNAILGILQFNGLTDAIIKETIPFWDIFSIHSCNPVTLNCGDVGIVDYFRQSAPPAGTLSNKNLAGSYLVVTLPLIFYLFITERKKMLKAISWCIFTAGIIFLVYTRSRASWISAVFACIVFALWLAINKEDRQAILKRLSLVTWAWIVAAIAIITTASFAESPVKGHSIGNSVSTQIDSIVKLDRSQLDTRIAYNINGMDMVLDNPLGTGLNSFHTMYPLYYNATYPTPALGYSLTARPQRMHNDIAQVFVELGIIGGMTFIALFISILVMTWRIARHCDHEESKLLSFTILVGLSGLGFNALGDFPLQMPTAAGLMWIMMGMTTGLYILHVPHAYIGLNKNLTLPQIAFIPATLIMVAVTIFVIHDDMKRREGATYLKVVMAYMKQDIVSPRVATLINKSIEIYPLNARAREYYSVINMRNPHMTSDLKKDIIRTTLKYDPNSASGWINLASNYINQAAIYEKTGNRQLMGVELLEMERIIRNKVFRLAPFAPHGYTLLGRAYEMTGQVQEAYDHFTMALQKDPSFKIAQQQRARFVKKLEKQGRVNYVGSVPNAPSP